MLYYYQQKNGEDFFMENVTEDFLGIGGSDALLSRSVELYSFLSINSTQEAAREHALANGTAPALFIANSQSEGRGRLGRSFFSPSGTGIYMTLLLDITGRAMTDTACVTSACAVAVAEAIERVTDKDCKIKWVNDIYADGLKVCGIITQTFCVGERCFLTIGIGVNVSTASFPIELAGIAGSLSLGKEDELRARLALDIFVGVFDICQGLFEKGDVSYMDEYRRRSCVLGRTVVFARNGDTFEGVAEEIDDAGGLIVKCKDGAVTLRSGEITLRINDGGGYR
ncbi:MAG: biotin--[acetyl-CoA-carboxylase] ligase [Clostridia bacterium]|nr:biotin--[acetyl-CoA-carboxylase] ligase [Clostridia bacterium]